MDESAAPEKESEKKAVDEVALVARLDKMFKYALDHPTWVDARKKMQRCHEYNEGDQWTKAEQDILKERKQPITTTNLVSVTVNKLVGELVDQRVRIGFRGRNAEADDASAALLSDIFIYLRQSNDLEFEEREMARDGFVSGFGVIEAYPTFDDLFQPEIKIAAEDSLVVFPDPDSKRYDWNEDAKFIARAKWLDADEAEEKYPKIKGHVHSLLTHESFGSAIAGGQLSSVEQFRNENYVDEDKKRVRLIEIQYKKYQQECIYLCADGEIIKKEKWSEAIRKAKDEAKIAWEKIDRVKPRIFVGLYGAGILIDHKETPRKYFSLVPYWVYRKKNGAPYSLITLALSIQDAINKRESKALHLLNTNQTLAERSAIKDKAEWADELAQPDGVAIAEDGALSQEKVILRSNLELAQGQQNMHGSAVQNFYAVTGINPNVVAQTGEIRSGSGLKTKFAEANKPIAPIFDNLKRTRKILGRVLLDLVVNYFTTEKLMLITDGTNKESRPVVINSAAVEKIKLQNYDVIVDDFEDHITVQQEQWALFLQYLPQILPFGNFWVKKLVKMSDLRQKDELVSELDQQNAPPPLVPRVSVQANIDNLPPFERAVYYELMGRPEVAQQIRAENTPTTTETKASVDLAKAKLQADRPQPQGGPRG